MVGAQNCLIFALFFVELINKYMDKWCKEVPGGSLSRVESVCFSDPWVISIKAHLQFFAKRGKTSAAFSSSSLNFDIVVTPTAAICYNPNPCYIGNIYQTFVIT